MGFSDPHIIDLVASTEDKVHAHRKSFGTTPFVKRIDTLAAEFPAHTNYLYTMYNASEHDVKFDNNCAMVLGGGVYCIGSSTECDWCAVTCARKLRDMGNQTDMINYNPKTVSTDFNEVLPMAVPATGMILVCLVLCSHSSVHKLTSLIVLFFWLSASIRLQFASCCAIPNAPGLEFSDK